MQFACLGSGSRGNATVVQSGRTRLLIDCGFSVRETERRLARLGVPPDSLTAVLVTHEHRDHGYGVAPLARKYGMAVWMTPGTHRALNFDGSAGELHLLSSHDSFVIQDLQIHPFPVPHDAAEPAQFVFDDGARRLGLLTDLGCRTPHVEHCLAGVDGLILECNHDRELLRSGPYPESLKRRVGGRLGHLSNEAAAQLLGALDSTRFQHLVAAHLSEQNNTPDRARRALGGVLGCAKHWIEVATQEDGLDWRTID